MPEEKKTLLEKARAANVRHHGYPQVTDELIDLVMAWGRGEIPIGKAAAALGKKPQTAYPIIAHAFQYMVMEGLLEPSVLLKEKEQ